MNENSISRENANLSVLSGKITEKIIKRLGISEKDIEFNKKAKTVVLISPDFFPRMSNEIAYTTNEIAKNLAIKGINTHLITYDPLKQGQIDEVAGFKVHYVGNPIRTYSPLTWSLTLSMEISRVIADIFHEEGNIDLIHAHEWLTFPAGMHLQAALKKPLLVNYYSIEHIRNPGICNGYTEAVKQIEWMSSVKSKKIFVNSDFLKDCIKKHYGVKENKINILDLSAEDFDKKIVRDYNWVVREWREIMEK